MTTLRVIARLDIKGPNVVKGVQFECLRVMGKPGQMAEEYYLQGADELLYIDIVASLYQRNNLLSIVTEAAKKVFIPITAGGGVRNIDDIRRLLEAGADKVVINTAATKNPELIKEAAGMFGSQCIVLSIEAKKNGENIWEAYTDNGRQKTGLDVLDWAERGEKLGAGEIFLTSVDREGTQRGFDLDLVRAVAQAVSVPVIASGGAGTINDVARCFKETGVQAVSAASILHYRKCDIDGIKLELLKDSKSVRIISSPKKIPTGGFQEDIIDYNKYTLRHLADYHDSEELKPKNDRSQVVLDSYDVGIVNYRINNVNSVVRAFRELGKKVVVIDTPEDMSRAACLVLPGVGAFAKGMRALSELNLIEPLKERIKGGTPFLGICLGMQLLFSESEEFGLHKGLDVIPGRVVSLPRPVESFKKNYRLPHIGWNQLIPYRKGGPGEWESTLLEDTELGSYVYFVHSFYPIPRDASIVVSVTEYGGKKFASVIKKNNISGTQFHPEKSGTVGTNMLKMFCATHNI